MPQQITCICPHCSNTQQVDTCNEQSYGCPISTCSSCGQDFIDKNVIEPAIDFPNINKPKMIHMSTILYSLIGLAILALGFAISFRIDLSYFYFLGPLGMVLLLIGITKIFETRHKYENDVEKREEVIEASKNRLNDHFYAQYLRESGYSIPEKYLVTGKHRY